MSTPRIVVLTGGVGGSKFVLGLRDALVAAHGPEAAERLTAIVNTGDDLWLSGVRLQPDIDSVMYALAGVGDAERGWGRAGESGVVASELQEYGAGWPWFTLGDLDLGTHLARTGWLREGHSPSEVVHRLASRWDFGVRLLPMTDAEVDTMVVVHDSGQGEPPEGSQQRSMHFQEWWTRHRASVPALSFQNPGVTEAEPAPDVVEAILAADAVFLAPSNPVVSLGPILAVPGIREALARTAARVVGISPIIGGSVVRGMAGECLQSIGVAVSADGVAGHYGARRSGGLLDAWFIDEVDRELSPPIADLGVAPRVRSIWMRDRSEAADLAAAALQAALDTRGSP